MGSEKAMNMQIFPTIRENFRTHYKNVQATAYKEHITACNEKSGEVI